MLAAARFEALLSAVSVQAKERAAATASADAVRRALGKHYGVLFTGDRTRLIGSWDKNTEVRPPRDVDVLITLPPALEEPVDAESNRPLELLHDVKEILGSVFRDAHLRRDGLSVIVADSFPIQVFVAFSRGGGRYDVCDAGHDGRFRRVAPDAERARIDDSDRRTSGNTRALIRLLKTWQAYREVPISSCAIEWLAIDALAEWPHQFEGLRYFDWMVRDAFGHMQRRADGDVDVASTGEHFSIGRAWTPLARLAHEHAVKACEYEMAGRDRDAWWEWEKIFGDRVPMD